MTEHPEHDVAHYLALSGTSAGIVQNSFGMDVYQKTITKLSMMKLLGFDTRLHGPGSTGRYWILTPDGLPFKSFIELAWEIANEQTAEKAS